MENFKYKYYIPGKIFRGKPMEDWLRFSFSWWHNIGSDSMKKQFKNTEGTAYEIEKSEIAFSCMNQLHISNFCIQGSGGCGNSSSLEVMDTLQKEWNHYLSGSMKKHGKKLLWGASNYINFNHTDLGASTSPSLDVFLHTLATAKIAVDTVIELGGNGFMFWGGKEGYDCIADTNLMLEMDNRADYLKKVIDYARRKGFQGEFYLEPKPFRPGRHQYHFDTAASILFLKQYGLEKDIRLCLDPYHAEIAGHEFDYEFRLAKSCQMAGTMDISPDRFLYDQPLQLSHVKDLVTVMYDLIEMGGFKNGGINFDPKDYKKEYTLQNILNSVFLAEEEIAWAFQAAAWLKENGMLDSILKERYADFSEKTPSGTLEEMTQSVYGKKIALRKRHMTEEKVEQILYLAISQVRMGSD